MGPPSQRLRLPAACAIAAVAAALVVPAASARPDGASATAALIQGKVPTPAAVAEGPIPVAATSFPWGAAARGRTPIDLAKRGYVELEYYVKGRANVYDEAPEGALSVLATGPYKTRILVRRPADPSRFSGSVIIELNNPTSNYDVDIMWAADHDHFMRRGDVYVGVSIKPVVFEALKTFDPELTATCR